MARPMTDDEFSELVHAAWPGLYRTAYLMLGDHQLAEDLTQTALAKTYASWRKVKDPAAAPAYARVVLANTAASWFRKRGWRNERPVEVVPETGVDADAGTRTMLLDAIATLAPRQRAVVVLRYYEDMSVREVAHALGISEGTVKSQTSDALDRLRDVLDDEAAAVRVPTADVAAVVGQGRRIRRDRQVRAVVAGATVVIVGALVAVLLGGGGGERPEPAKLPDDVAYQQLGAWARGDEVHVGNHTAAVPGAAQLQYTSVGVVVSTDTGPKVLVQPDGEATTLDLDLHVSDPIGRYDTVATDVTEPYLAYVRVMDDGMGQLSVRDLSTGDETTMGEPFRVGHRRGSVDSLWADQVGYLRGDRGVLADWRTGERLPFPRHGFVFRFDVLGHGVTLRVDEDTREWVVRSRTDDEILLEVPVDDMATGTASLSPDGRYLATSTDRGLDVYVVATGDRVSLVDRAIHRYGWTPDGHLVGSHPVDRENPVEVCDPVTGECEGTGTAVDTLLTLVNSSVSAGG